MKLTVMQILQTIQRRKLSLLQTSLSSRQLVLATAFSICLHADVLWVHLEEQLVIMYLCGTLSITA